MYKLTIQDCGRFFDDYVLEDSNGFCQIKQLAKDLDRDKLKLAKKSPEHAKAVLEIAAELEPEVVDEIVKSGKITKQEYDFFLCII